MAGADQETEVRPITRDLVMETIPLGQRAYIMAHMLLSKQVVNTGPGGRPDVNTSNLRDAIGLLARAHAREELVPPLPDALGDALTQISDTIS